MLKQLCQGKIKLLKKDIKNGIEDSCHNLGTELCEDCGKYYCHNHTDRDKHKCDDSIKGCHGMLK